MGDLGTNSHPYCLKISLNKENQKFTINLNVGSNNNNVPLNLSLIKKIWLK